MRPVYMLYETDAWHTQSSKQLLFVGTSVKNCALYIKRKYKRWLDKQKIDTMVEELLLSGQTQCNNVGFEFNIEPWHTNDFRNEPYEVG